MNRKELSANFVLVVIVGGFMGLSFAGMENPEPTKIMTTLFGSIFVFAILNYPVHKILGN